MARSERRKQSDARYRQQHRFAIRLKNQMYKRTPRARKLARESNRRRKDYYRKWYAKNRERLILKAKLWAEENRERKRSHQRKYKRKMRYRAGNASPKIKRIVEEFYQYSLERHKGRTAEQYKAKLGRFLSYIEKPGTHGGDYHKRMYEEGKKPPEERDYSWTKEYHKIRFTTELTRDLITDYVSYINHDAVNDKGMKLNQPEKESRLYPLKAFLLYCQRRGYVKKDLRRFVIVPPREKKVLKRVLTREEMARLIESPGDKESLRIRDRALLELSYSGFRANEILSLKVKDVDLETNAVTILNGKGDKDRVVPMTREAVYWIKRWRARRREFMGGHNDPGFLFITSRRKTISRRHFSKMILKYARDAKIPMEVAPHDLRRVTATHLAENGAPIRLIQALLGHATLKVTTKYLRLTDEKIKQEHKETHPASRRDLYYGRVQE